MAKVKKEASPSARLESIGIESICAYVANGDSLRSWAILNGFALSTVRLWIESDAERSANYARAREERADAVFDSLDDLCQQAVAADNAVQVAGLRLKADTIKWKLARMNAKKYGEKIAIDAEVKLSDTTDEQLNTRLSELIGKAGIGGIAGGKGAPD